MSNSPLVTYTKLTENKTSPRNHKIDTITIHCIVGQWTAKQGCDYFANTKRQASANYVVGRDGSIGLSVNESDRSWCSSNSSNDHRAVTIEVASDTSHPYAVTDAAYKALIQLVADICKRNGIKQLLWKGDKSLIGQVDKQNMTVHRWFAAKACPGDYLYSRHGDIASKVNAILAEENGSEMTLIEGTAQASIDQMVAYLKNKNPNVAQSVIDMIPFYVSEGAAEGIRSDIAFAQSCLETGNFTFSGSAVTLDQNNFCGMGVTKRGMKGNSFPSPQLGIRAQVQHLKAYATDKPLTNECIDSRFKYVQRGSAPFVEYLGIQENPKHVGWAAGKGYGSKILNILNALCRTHADQVEEFKPYTIRVKVPDLNIRRDATIDADAFNVTRKGVFTIVDEKQGKISKDGKVGKWGLLKSYSAKRNGWVCLAFDQYTERI